jgi:alcohol dehydrogenase
VIGSNSWAPEDLVTLMDMIKAKRLDPIVDSRLALADTREGVRKLRDREVIGKVIINP